MYGVVCIIYIYACVCVCVCDSSYLLSVAEHMALADQCFSLSFLSCFYTCARSHDYC